MTEDPASKEFERLHQHTGGFSNFENQKHREDFEKLMASSSPSQIAKWRRSHGGFKDFAVNRDPTHNVSWDETLGSYNFSHGGEEYSLVKNPYGTQHYWDLYKKGTHDPKDPFKNNLGYFAVHSDYPSAPIKISELNSDLKGTGLGSKIYSILAAHHGGLSSDKDLVTSDEAQRIWKSLAKKGIAKADSPDEDRWSRHRIVLPKVSRQVRRLVRARKMATESLNPEDEDSEGPGLSRKGYKQFLYNAYVSTGRKALPKGFNVRRKPLDLEYAYKYHPEMHTPKAEFGSSAESPTALKNWKWFIRQPGFLNALKSRSSKKVEKRYKDFRRSTTNS